MAKNMFWRPSQIKPRPFQLRRYHVLILLIIGFLLCERYTNGWIRYLSLARPQKPCSDRSQCRSHCGEPAQPPITLTEEERAQQDRPDSLPNPYEPIVVESESIRVADLDRVAKAEDRPRFLILTPSRDAASHLEKHFELLSQLTYPHHSIDLAFLVGDSTDDTLEVLRTEIDRL